MTRARSIPRAEHTPTARVRRALAGLVAAALVLMASMASGTTYLWCGMMQQEVASCCCARQADGAAAESDRGPALASDCCQARAHRVLPASSPGADASHGMAPLAPVAIATPPAPYVVNALRRTPRIASPTALRPTSAARAGPRSATARRAELQVFHC